MVKKARVMVFVKQTKSNESAEKKKFGSLGSHSMLQNPNKV